MVNVPKFQLRYKTLGSRSFIPLHVMFAIEIFETMLELSLKMLNIV